MAFSIFAKSENFRFHEDFAKMLVFEKFCENITKDFRFRKHFRENLKSSLKYCLSKHCHPLAVLSSPVQGTCEADLSNPTRLNCPVPVVRSQNSLPRCPVEAVLGKSC